MSRGCQATVRNTGRRVLVVEDDYHLAQDMRAHLQASGADVIGPVATVAEAQALLRDHDGVALALLNLRRQDEDTFSFADQLSQQGIPYVFSMGNPLDSLPERFRGAPILLKPIGIEDIRAVLAREPLPRGEPVRPLANRLLRILPEEVQNRLRPHMSLVPLVPGQHFARFGERISRVIFPESGVISLTLSHGDRPVEVGVVGQEGAIGLWGLFGLPSASDVMCQLPGVGTAIGLEEMSSAVDNDRQALSQLLKYLNVLAIQTSCTAASNAADSVQTRLARWLLMCADRMGPELPLVHDYISKMLHVRRAGVTTALHVLEGEGLIKATRGHIRIRDRAGLISAAGSFYGRAEQAHRDLFLSGSDTPDGGVVDQS